MDHFSHKSLPLLVCMTIGFSGCWVKKTTCRGLHNQMPETCSEFTKNGGDSGPTEAAGVIPASQPEDTNGTYTVPATPIESTTQTSNGPGFSLTRVTPEQLSNNIVAAINFGADPGELRWNDEFSGQTHDYLQLLFGVPLGGIDFETTSVRDRSTKAQTLLVSRVVAMLLTQAALGKEWNLGDGNRVVFNKCDFNVDRPFRDSDNNAPPATQTAVKEGEAKWLNQVEDLFFRFYARPPTTTEIAAVKTAFNSGMDAEGYPLAGWVPVLYALLASQEFWHQ